MCDAALARGLTVDLDAHHHDELCADVARETPRFLALWEQLGRRFAGTGPGLCLELLNEAAMQLDRRLGVARAPAPRARGCAGDGPALPRPRRPRTLQHRRRARRPSPARRPAPRRDRPLRLAVPLHPSGGDLDPWGAEAWRGTQAGNGLPQRARARSDLERAAGWARAGGDRCSSGSSGTIAPAPIADRAAWTTLVRAEAERVGAGVGAVGPRDRLRRLRPRGRALARAAAGRAARSGRTSRLTAAPPARHGRAECGPPPTPARRKR